MRRLSAEDQDHGNDERQQAEKFGSGEADEQAALLTVASTRIAQSAFEERTEDVTNADRSHTGTGFIDNMLEANIGKAGRKYVPYVFSLFMFILFANILGLMPLGVIGLHPFTFTSHFTVTGVLAIISFAIVLLVGFWKHGLHFFSLFVPHGTPLPMIPIIAPIEFISFMVRPFSLGLRLFVAMMAGHVLLEVLSSFVIDGTNAGILWSGVVGLPSFLLMIGICARSESYGQRGSRCGAPAPRVSQLPFGAWYFSPGLVARIAWQPAVSAYSSSVALFALARSE